MTRPTFDLTRPGWVIAAAIVVLVTIGVSSIYVTDTHYVAGHDGPQNAAKQCIRVVLSLVLAVIVLRLGYQHIARYAYGIFVAALLLLVPLVIAKLLHTSMGGLTAPRNGAYRWLHLPGFPLQPSELMKVAYVLALAWYLRYRKNYRRLTGLVVPLLVSCVPLVLILLQPDLGTALLMVPVLFVMLFMAGARMWHLALIALVAVAAMPPAWGQLRGYQRARVTAVFLQSEHVRRAVIDQPDRFAGLATKRQAIEWAASSG